MGGKLCCIKRNRTIVTENPIHGVQQEEEVQEEEIQGIRAHAVTRVPHDVTWDDTVPFVIPISDGRVIKVYDGDSITVAAALPYPQSALYRVSVRLNGIDAPELRTTNDSEKELAVMAKHALAELVMGKWVRLRETSMDKYGRLLAEVYVGRKHNEIHVNQWMINKRFATGYDGGTKHVPDDWMKFHRSVVVASEVTE